MGVLRARSLIFAALFVMPLLAGACGDGGDVQIVAITRTPGPDGGSGDDDTSILTPTANTETATPRPPSVEVPSRPDNLLAGGLLVASYLAGGEADIEGCLPRLVEAWRLPDVDGERCVLANISGDAEPELIFVLNAGDGEMRPGDVWFFERPESEDARLDTTARVLSNETLEGVKLEAVEDLTGDRVADPVISSQSCEGDVCTFSFVIASGHTGSLRDLAPADLAIASLESLSLEDDNDDGITDLVMQGGEALTAGAGPTRSSQLVLTWSGLFFLERERPDAPTYIIHAIEDADAAFAAAQYTEARALYEDAATNRTLLDWRVEVGQPAGRPELVAYAGFRAGLATLFSGDSDGALDRLRQVTVSSPDTLHGQVAAVYLAGLQAGTQPSVACSTVETFLRPQSARFATIWDYGFSNPEHNIAGLCR